MLAFLPWAIIWKLNIQLKEKLGIGIAMSCGILCVSRTSTINMGPANSSSAGIMAAVKTAHLVNLDTGDSCKFSLPGQDFRNKFLILPPDDAAILNIWDSAEVSVTIIAASIPTLRVLLRDMVVSNQDTGSDGTGNTQGQNHSSIVKPRQRLNWTGNESIADMAQGRIHGVDELGVQDVSHDKRQATESEDDILPIDEKKSTKTPQDNVTT